MLNQQRRQRRMAWLTARHPSNFGLTRWRQVLFSDESRYLLNADIRQRVYRRLGERISDPCMLEGGRHGGDGVMVWTRICHGHNTSLIFIECKVTVVRYRGNRLAQVFFLPFVQRHNGIYQQDNVRPHVARVCRDYLASNNVNVLRVQHVARIYHLYNIYGIFLI